jgi:hypothetical protein
MTMATDERANDDTILACDLTAMDDAQRERYRALRDRLEADVREVRELDDGYAFRCSSSAEMLLTLAEYVSLERLCCPFLDFALEVGRAGGDAWLKMTGPAGAKQVLQAEMGARP